MKTSLGGAAEMLYCNIGRPGRSVPVEAHVDMKWFRANIKQGSRLALLALAIQFVLSFGHVHASHARPELGQARHVMHAAATHALDVVWGADTAWGIRSKTPSDHHSDHGLADDCPICAVLALASAMLSVHPPALPAPQAAEFAYLITNAAAIDLNCASAAFQPRGPPVA